jgi:hypothetical protein
VSLELEELWADESQQDHEITEFAKRFNGNKKARGGDDGRAIWEPVTNKTYENHLIGLEPCGIYPSIPQLGTDKRKTFWGCCDIDTGEWSEAYQLASALAGMGLVPNVERSRSKGWHVWIFVEKPVDVVDMRRCLKVAYAAIDLPAKEANPKSEMLRPDQLGNYVRLPYKGGLVIQSSRQCMMGNCSPTQDGYPIPFKEWITMDVYSDPDKVSHWASKWFEPPRPLLQLRNIDVTQIPDLVERMPKRWKKTWDGSNVKGDRSAALVALGYGLAKLGWKPDDVYNVLWCSPLNKYAERNGGEVYVQDIVTRVYTR